MRIPTLTKFLLASLFTAGLGMAGETVTLEYPYGVIASSNPDNDCWTGMDLYGLYPVPVDLERWLVGAPPSNESAVTLPGDHWVELGFRGTIADGPGPDILVSERQKVGEQALVLIADGKHSPYPLGIVTADTSNDAWEDRVTEIEMDLSGQVLPFSTTRIRVVGLDTGRGRSSGFDLGCIRAGIIPSQTPWATCPYPLDGACDVPPDVVLKWQPGPVADRHSVYFGSTLAEVGVGASPVKSPQQPQVDTHLDPGPLQLGQRYYWRVDEVCSSSGRIEKGDVWIFEVAHSCKIDDFESLPFAWEHHEGWFTRMEFSELPNPVYEGCRAVELNFNLNPDDYTGIAHEFDPPQDWTALGAEVLELALHGHPDNPRMVKFYLRLFDGQKTITLLYDGDPNTVIDPQWHLWKIPFSSLSELDLSQIHRMVLGVVGDPIGNAWGKVYLDSIALYRERYDAAQCRQTDLNRDCRVDYHDLSELADTWLDNGHPKLIVKEPHEPVAWYRFEGNAADSVGSAHGQIEGQPTFVEGRVGRALSLSGVQERGLPPDHVRIPDANSIFQKIEKGLTMAFWQLGKDTPHVINTLVCSDLDYGRPDPALHITLGCWNRPGYYQWQCGNPSATEDSLYGSHAGSHEWTGHWNHWTFAKNLGTGQMDIFLNGSLYATQQGLPSDLTEIQGLRIGNGWYGYYDGLYGYYEGLIDELRIYNYPLCQAEAAYLATEDGAGIPGLPLDLQADLNGDDRIDCKDFALLAHDWLAGPNPNPSGSSR